MKRSRRNGPQLTLPAPLLAALEAEAGSPLDAPAFLKVISRGVAALSEGLTRDRERFLNEAYLKDHALRAAYAAYFVATNAPKLWPILDALARRDQLAPRLKVLDLGCGPGTGVAALASWRGALKLDVVAADLVPENTRAAASLGRRLGVSVTPKTLDLTKSLPELGTFDLILLMNVVNELPPSGDAALLAGLAKATQGPVIVIDPAARDASRRSLAFRDQALSAGWSTLFPCPASYPCPALAQEGDWCHGEWRFERPDFVQAIDKVVGTRREVLKATYYVLTKAATVPDPALGRLVSERFDEKGRHRAFVCLDQQRLKVELWRRDVDKSTEAFAEAARHDLVRFEALSPVAEGLRVTGPCSLAEPCLAEDA